MQSRMSTAIPERLRRFALRGVGEVSVEHRRVSFEQTGDFRMKPDGKWLPFTAEQWMAIDEVAFCWHARVKMAPLLTAVVEDAYEDGHGRLDAKMWGALPLAHAEGPEVDRGEIQRYLAELPWNPAAILRNDELRFEERDAAVRVWTRDPQTYVDFFFDEEGDAIRCHTETRSRGEEGPTPWEGRYSRYARLAGLRVPVEGTVAWILADGPFEYFRGAFSSYTFT